MDVAHVGLGHCNSCECNFNPLEPKPFLEGQCFFSKFLKRIEGVKN